MAPPSAYRGRFAPTPSGLLHAGSLVAAVGSYLDARSHQGKWLLRIEDIDPPREVPGAADTIQRQLEAHGLHWDGPVRYQSASHELYQHLLQQLTERNLVYFCNCTRKQVKARAPFYTGFCRNRTVTPENAAIRFKNDKPVTELSDRVHGSVELERAYACEDFILKRRDGFWAYQLAVVADDIDQGITDIVRGSDLLIPSAWQMTLWQTIAALPGRLHGLSSPRLAHLPLVNDKHGRKLSKQNHAPGLDLSSCADNLFLTLQHLGLEPSPELKGASCSEILTWGTSAWQLPRQDSC